MKNKSYVCCICGDKCEGFGNNPDGAMWRDADTLEIVRPEFKANARCCDVCNSKYVIMGRLYAIQHAND